jgi:hypothetical protein
MCLRTGKLDEWFNYFFESAILKCLMRSNVEKKALFMLNFALFIQLRAAERNEDFSEIEFESIERNLLKFCAD